jgi:hypothetical protein
VTILHAIAMSIATGHKTRPEFHLTSAERGRLTPSRLLKKSAERGLVFAFAA